MSKMLEGFRECVFKTWSADVRFVSVEVMFRDKEGKKITYPPDVLWNEYIFPGLKSGRDDYTFRMFCAQIAQDVRDYLTAREIAKHGTAEMRDYLAGNNRLPLHIRMELLTEFKGE